MTRPIDIEGELERWFADGPDEVADRVIVAALADIETTSQRTAGVVGRWRPDMLATHRLGRSLSIAAAALAVVAVGGLALVNSQRQEPAATGVPTPSVPAVVASPAPPSEPPSSNPATLTPASAPPSDSNLSVNPAVPLPDDVKGLAALLPDTLCGRPAVKTTYQAPPFVLPNSTDYVNGDPIRLMRVDSRAPGMSYDRGLEVTASSVGVKSCFTRDDINGHGDLTLGVFRVIGADPAWFRHAIVDSTFTSVRFAIRPLAGKELLVATPRCDVPGGMAICGRLFDYFYFTGDAVFFLGATDDASAEPILKVLP